MIVSFFSLCISIDRFSNLVKDYCGVLTEESIQLNFALINELVDEIIVSSYMCKVDSDIMCSSQLIKSHIFDLGSYFCLLLKINFTAKSLI